MIQLNNLKKKSTRFNFSECFIQSSSFGPRVKIIGLYNHDYPTLSCQMADPFNERNGRFVSFFDLEILNFFLASMLIII